MTLEIDPVKLIIQSPKAKQYVREISTILAKEEGARSEFYNQITEGDKAEFINGEIIFHSPVKLRHNRAGSNLQLLMTSFVNRHNLGLVGYEKLMISLTRNDYEPDICFFGLEKANEFEPDQMRFPAPDFVVEILSKSTAVYDRGVKFEDYAAHGVMEYWIIDPEEETLEQYLLEDEQYELKVKSSSGEVSSQAIVGFQIPIRAVFDRQINTETLQKLMG